MKTLLGVCFVSTLFLSGCFSYFVYVHDRYPVIPTPEKPVISLSENPTYDELAKAAYEYKTYALQLEDGITEYNQYAEKKNKEYEYIVENKKP